MPITSGYKFFGSDQHIYILCDKNKFIGFIKVGKKHLFIYDEVGVPIEINPLCVLDFYTYETCQRKGYGKIMFSEMLSKEKILPRKLGIDRPSSKFLNFLQKYYGLKDYVPQNNNFVVFKDYFIDEPQRRDKYDIYSHNYNYNYSNSKTKDNYNSGCNSNYNSDSKSKNILTQRKLGKYNQINNNENISYNNTKNYEDSNQKEKEFTTRIYKEYYNKSNDEYQKEIEQEKEKEKDDENEYHSKLNKKKSFGYNQYQSTSSEYGAFFHMNK